MHKPLPLSCAAPIIVCTMRSKQSGLVYAHTRTVYAHINHAVPELYLQSMQTHA